MTTIILTIIGILLAAAAALMVIFYGGDAFNSGSVGAQANTFQNAGTNVIAAHQLYLADGNARSTETLQKLKDGVNGSGSYLKEDPALPGGVQGAINSGATVYSVAVADADVCTRINKNLKVNTTGSGTAGQPGYVAPATATSVKMGCFSGTFYANL